MSQASTKFIADNAINDLKVRLRNNQSLRARNAANDGDVSLFKVNTSDIIEAVSALTMGSNALTVATPTLAGHAATKAYVDALSAGLAWKDAVRAATAAVLPAVTYANGSSGAGATLTADANGALAAQDGITLIANDRLLVKDQAAGLQNGIYVVTQVGDGSNPFILTRATDADVLADMEASAAFVEEGTTLGDTGWVLSTDNFTVGTTALVFVQFTGAGLIVAGAGLTKTVNTLDVGAGDGITVNANDVAVNTTAIAGTGLENDGSNNLRIAAAAAGDGIQGGAGSALSISAVKSSDTLDGTDITNQYVDLAVEVLPGSLHLVIDGITQIEGAGKDYTLSTVSNVTRVTFATRLATGGQSELISGDILEFSSIVK